MIELSYKFECALFNQRRLNMKKQSGETIKKYALRKLSQGFFSVAIGAIFLTGVPQIPVQSNVVKADEITQNNISQTDTIQLGLKHVLETELSAQQRQNISTKLPAQKLSSNQTYYLVYQKDNSQKLPQTGEANGIFNYAYLGITIGVLGWALLTKKSRKSKFMASLIIASSLSGLPAYAMTSSDTNLKNYDRTIELSVNSDFPNINTYIPGYKFVGYLAANEQNVSNKKSQNNNLISQNVAQVDNQENKQLNQNNNTNDDIRNNITSNSPTAGVASENTPSTPTTPVKPELKPSVSDNKPSTPETPAQPDVKPDAPEQKPTEKPIAPAPTQPDTKPEVKPSTPTTPTKPEVKPSVPDNNPSVPVEPSKPEVKPDTPEQKPTEKPVAPAPTQPDTKPEVKPSIPTTPTKPEVKPSVPDNKPSVPVEPTKPEVKPDTPEQKPTEKPVAPAPTQPDIKPEVKPSTPTTPVKPEVKPSVPDNKPSTPEVPDSKPSIPATTTKTETTSEVIPFETQKGANDKLDNGITNIKVTGENGEKTLVYQVTYDQNNKELSRKLIKTSITKQPVTQIIEYGTKPKVDISKKEITEIEVIPYQTQNIDNPNLLKGETKQTVIGENGERTNTYLVTMENDKEVTRELIKSEITKTPVNAIVEHGTKVLPQTYTKDVTVEEVIPFTSQTIDNPDLSVGQQQIKVAGENGLRTIIYKVTYDVAGTELNRIETSNSVTKLPVQEIIERGTKPIVIPEPEGQDIQVNLNDPVPAAQIAIKNSNDLPEDTKYVWKNDVSTKAAGDFIGTIVATYPNGTLHEVTVNIKVIDNRPDNEKYHLSAKTIEIYRGDAIPDVMSGVNGINDLPQNIKINWIKEPDINKVGLNDYDAKIIFPDESQTVLSIPVNVNLRDNEKYSVDINKIVVSHNQIPNVNDGISNLADLPSNTKISWENQPDTSEPDTIKNYDALVQYPDDSEIKISIPVQVLVDKTGLQANVDSVNNYDQAKYTFDSWQNLQNNLQKAHNILNTSDSKLTQTQIDNADNYLKQSINNLVLLKAKPVVALINTTNDIFDKSATVTYQVTDKDQTIKQIVLDVTIDGKTVQTDNLNLETLSTKLNNLDYDVPYQVTTEITYNIGTKDDQVQTLPNYSIQLEPKKVALNDFNHINLVKVNDDGSTSPLIGLQSVPTDTTKLLAKITSPDKKDIYLPITNIKENETNDKYQVTINYPDLVQYDGDQKVFKPDYQFMVNKIVPTEGTYTSFAKLINDMNANPSGKFVIGTDLTADEMPNNSAESYVPTQFTGELSSANPNYKIYNLKKPLFSQLTRANIHDLNLADVNISGTQSEVGALSKRAYQTKIDNVHAAGNITAPVSAGGLLCMIAQVNIKNSSFTGNITITNNNNNNYLGGLVGYMYDHTSVSNSYADVNLTANANTNDNKIGGLLGKFDNSNSIKNAYAKGSINNTGTAGFVGGLVGSAYWNGSITNAISFMKINLGNKIHGDTGYTTAPFTNVYYVNDIASGNDYPNVKGISENEASDLIKSWNIPSVDLHTPVQKIDFTQVTGYQADHDIAYQNMAKLLPFYDRYTLVRYGNLVDNDSKLNKVAVLAVIPIQNNVIVGSAISNPQVINQILIHYADHTIDKMDANYHGKFENTNILEYNLADGLLYTPMQFGNDYQDQITQVLSKMQSIKFLSPEMLQHFNLMWTDDDIKAAQDKAVNDYKNNANNPAITPEKEAELRNQAQTDLQNAKYDKLRDLYLMDQFEQTQANLKAELVDVLGNSAVMNLNNSTENQLLSEKLANHQLDILLGLSYLNRLYNINFDKTNILSLVKYHPDFYGNAVDALDWIISVGQMNYDNLTVKNNYNAYGVQFAKTTGISNLLDYLDDNRVLFAPQMDENTWFKSATKAYISENESKEVPNAEVRIYPRLKGMNRAEYRNYILPLLNLREDNVFMITTMSTISFGMYERYVDPALKIGNPALYAKKVADFHQQINDFGVKYARYFDTWYRIVDPSVRSRLLTRDIPVWDGYWIIDNTQTGYYKNRWVGKYDETTSSMMDFFGAIGKWYGGNGTGAYATGSLVHFVVDASVTDYGTSVLTHEMTHNFDGGIYLNGYDRRTNQGAESFAQGLLQTPSGITDGAYGLNLVYNFDDTKLRTKNASPLEFQNAKDVGDYMHGVFDVTYLMDALEAQETLKQNKDVLKKLYSHLTFDDNAKADKVVPFTDAEWHNMNLKSINDLVDNNVISTRLYGNQSYGRNNYITVGLYAPIYAGIQNSNDTSGGLVFRKTAFELMAAKGYDDGFVSYVSNRFKKDAQADGVPYSDTYIIKKIFGNEYASFADFKKAMYAQRLQEAQTVGIKPIDIRWNNQNVHIGSYADMQKLFSEAVQKDVDLAMNNRNLHYIDDLKAQILQAYHLSTDDFKNSIFN